MNKDRMNEIVSLIEREVKPALGCTEPVAVALASANAALILNEHIEKIEVEVSGNVLKNGMGVGIPGTGMIGLHIASALGAIGGDPKAELKVLETASAIDIETAKRYVEEKKITLINVDLEEKLYIKATVFGKTDKSSCTISGGHTNIVSKTKNDVDIFKKESDSNSQKKCSNKDCSINCKEYDCSENQTTITIEEIYTFATLVPKEMIYFLKEGADLNKAIAIEALEGDYGLNVGKMMKTNIASKPLQQFSQLVK